MKRFYALGVSLVLSLLALAFAGNAAANDGSGSGNQTAVGSAGTVQVGSVSASPSTAVNAPVNANAPVSVGSETGGSSAQQESGGASASSASCGCSDAGSQTAKHSIGTVQVGSVNASPSTAVNAPVDANAPVSVGSETGDSSAQQESGGASASSASCGCSDAGSQSTTHETHAHPASSCCDDQTSPPCDCKRNSNDKPKHNIVWGDAPQRAVGSLLTVQLGKIGVAPATAVNAPVNVNAPVSVLSNGGSATAEQESGGAQASTATECGEATGSQSGVRSIGTVQVGSVDVAPATAVNAPINVNAPVAELSGGGCDESAAQKSGGATAVAGPLV